MDPRERIEDLSEAVGMFVFAERADIWTALPGIIQSYNATARTCRVRPAQMVMVKDKTGTKTPVALPELLDCPVVFPAGGGCALTFPLQLGDECLVVFGSRCIDAWWQSGEVSLPGLLRMHDLSDGFVIPGPRSLPQLPVVPASTTKVQLRTDSGTATIDIDPVSEEIDIKSSVQVAVTAPAINIGGEGGALRALVTDLFMDLFNNHSHTSASPGSPTSAPVVPMTIAQTTTNLKGS